jgi:hypothetical protein
VTDIEALRARHNDIPQDALPLDLPDMGGGAKDQRVVKSYAQAICPWHTDRGDDQTTGLIRAGNGGLVFREHTKRIGKTTVRCPGSGQSPEMKEDSA